MIAIYYGVFISEGYVTNYRRGNQLRYCVVKMHVFFGYDTGNFRLSSYKLIWPQE